MRASLPFEEVVAEYGATVLRVCRALAGPDQADDAWSETFLAALRAYPELAPGSNIEAWLVTIAKRKSIDEQRSRSRRAVPVERLDEHAAAPAPPPEERHAIWQALGELTPLRREAVVYHYIAGMPYGAVGPILGRSEAAARRAAADGIAQLRRIYQQEENR